MLMSVKAPIVYLKEKEKVEKAIRLQGGKSEKVVSAEW